MVEHNFIPFQYRTKIGQWNENYKLLPAIHDIPKNNYIILKLILLILLEHIIYVSPLLPL
jgi:hypothetical protein